MAEVLVEGYAVFQAVFGMIITVIIALKFKNPLLVVAERRDSIVQIRSVVMIALLAICRKVIILDLTETRRIFWRSQPRFSCLARCTG